MLLGRAKGVSSETFITFHRSPNAKEKKKERDFSFLDWFYLLQSFAQN